MAPQRGLAVLEKGSGPNRVVGYAPLAYLAGFERSATLPSLNLHSPALQVLARAASGRYSLEADAVAAQHLSFNEDPMSLSASPVVVIEATAPTTGEFNSSEVTRASESDARVKCAVATFFEKHP